MIPAAQMGIAGASRGTGALVYLSPPRMSNVMVMLHADGPPGGSTIVDSSPYARTVANSGTFQANGPVLGNPVISFTTGDYLSVPARDSVLEEWSRLGTDFTPVTIEGTWTFDEGNFRRLIVGAGRPLWWGFSVSPLRDSIDFHCMSLAPECGLLIPRLSAGVTYRIAIQVRGVETRDFHVWIDGVYRGHVVSRSAIQYSLGRVGEDSSLIVGNDVSPAQFTGSLDEFRVTNELFLPVGGSYTPLARFSDSDGPVIAIGGSGLITGFFLLGVSSQETFGQPTIQVLETVLTGIPSVLAFGLAGVVAEEILVGIPSQETIGVVGMGGFGIALSGILSSAAFGGTDLSLNVFASGVASSEAVGSLAVAPAVTEFNPSFANVKLLMHGEGTAGTQTYTDSSVYHRTSVGNSLALVSAAQSFQGSSSIHISGPVNLTVPFNTTIGGNEWARMGTDAFPMTIEMAVRPDVAGVFLLGEGNAARGPGFWWGFTLATTSSIQLNEGNFGEDTTISLLSPLPLSSWSMLAIAMRGTTNREFGVWVDGVWQGSAVSTFTPQIVGTGSADDKAINIGRLGGGFQYSGYFDELRVSEELFLPWGSNYTLIPGSFPDSPLTFAPGASFVAYADGDRTVTATVSPPDWAVIPLSTAVPTTGKWYVEFDVTGLISNQMFGVWMDGNPVANMFIGSGSAGTAGASNGDGARLSGSTFSWADVSSFSSSPSDISIGISVDSNTGHVLWYINHVLHATDAAFTPGTAGIYIAVSSHPSRGPITLKLPSDAVIPSGYLYLTA